MGRTHGISISFLHQETLKPYAKLGYIASANMAADILTKFYSSRKATVWNSVRKLINVITPEELAELNGSPGRGWKNASEYPTRYEARKPLMIQADEEDDDSDKDEGLGTPRAVVATRTEDERDDDERTKTRSILTVGTDFSGIDAPIYALRQMGIRLRHVFSSETENMR